MSSKLRQKAAKAAASATSGPGTYTKQQLLELSVASEEKIRSLLQVSLHFLHYQHIVLTGRIPITAAHDGPHAPQASAHKHSILLQLSTLKA
jgi:hypothetical protein